jgi:Family of unknown function (DUF5681)
MTRLPRKALSGHYKVGYGRPPPETRFRKGVSGNPGGRPRGMTAGRAKRLALQEAYRPVTVREGDEVGILPTIQAVMRQQARSAAKGNRPAQRHFIDRVQAIEQEALTDESLTHKGDAENPLLGPVTDADRIKALVSLLQENPEVLKILAANPVVMKLLK